MYLLAIVLPPIAVLLCGKPVQALLNFGLLFLLWIPASIHALFIVSNTNAERRQKRLIKALRSPE